MTEGIRVATIYYELGWQVEKAVAGAAAFEATGSRISQTASQTTASMNTFVGASLKSAEAIREVGAAAAAVAPPVDRVTAGMSAAGKQASALDANLKQVAQQEALARLEAERLARPLDTVAAGLTKASQASKNLTSGNLIGGLTRAAEESTARAQQLGAAGTEGSKGVNKIQNALVNLALTQTQTSATTGKIIEGLLLLGAGSLAVTGAAAGIALLSAAWNELTRKQREARAAQDELITRLREGAQTPLSRAEADLRAAEAAVDQLQRKIDNLKKPSTEPVAPPNFIGGLAPSAPPTPPRAAGPSDEDADRLNALLIARNRARTVLEQAQKDEADRRRREEEERKRALEALRRDLTERFTTQVPATIEATANALARLQTELLKTGAPAAEVDKAVAPLVERLRQLREAALVNQLGVIEGGPSAADSLAELDALSAELVEKQLNVTAGSDEELAIRRQLALVAAAIARTNERIATLSERTEEATEGTAVATATLQKSTSQIVTQVAEIARGAIGIAQGMGLASDHAAALLQNVVSVGSSLPGLFDSLDKLGKVGSIDPATQQLAIDPETLKPFAVDQLAIVGQITSIVGGVVGLVSGLTGDSPEAKRLREATEHNADVISKLTEEIGNLNVNISGTDFAKGGEVVSQLLATIPKGTPDVSGLVDPTLKGVLSQLGFTKTELKELAAAFDIKLDFDNLDALRETLEQLQEAMNRTEFAQFSDSFEGAMQQLADAAQIYHRSAQEQLDALAATLERLASKGKGSKVITDALTGLNLDDPSQRAEARRRLETLFEQLSSNTIKPEDLGLSLDQFRDLLKQLTGLIDQVNQDQGVGSPTQETFGVTRQITDAQADLLISAGQTTNTWLGQIAQDTGAIADLLASLSASSGFIPPPPLPASSVTGPGGTSVMITIQSITVTVNAPSSAPVPAIVDGVRQGVAEGVDRALGQILNLKAARYGNVRVT